MKVTGGRGSKVLATATNQVASKWVAAATGAAGWGKCVWHLLSNFSGSLDWEGQGLGRDSRGIPHLTAPQGGLENSSPLDAPQGNEPTSHPLVAAAAELKGVVDWKGRSLARLGVLGHGSWNQA